MKHSLADSAQLEPCPMRIHHAGGSTCLVPSDVSRTADHSAPKADVKTEIEASLPSLQLPSRPCAGSFGRMPLMQTRPRLGAVQVDFVSVERLLGR